MHFDLADLRLFLAILDAGSITHGARSANLSVSAASERLRDMEVSGGVLLLERGRRGVAPTRAGEALAHHARLVLHRVAAMQNELSEHARAVRATVRLLANTAAMTEFLPERLAPWLAAHSRADVDLVERPSAEIVKAVTGGLADIGIISDAVDAAGLATRPFAIDGLVAVMPRTHPIAVEKRIAFSRMFGEDYIGIAAALQDHIDHHAAREGYRLRPRVRVRTFEGVCRIVAGGAGLGIVPEAAARRCRRSMPIAIVPLSDAWAARRLLLCVQEGQSVDPLMQQLVEHLSRDRPLQRSRAPEIRVQR